MNHTHQKSCNAMPVNNSNSNSINDQPDNTMNNKDNIRNDTGSPTAPPPPDPPEPYKKNDGAAPTTPPMNDNSAGEHEQIEHRQDTTPASSVDHGVGPADDIDHTDPADDLVNGETVDLQIPIPTCDIDLDSIAVDQDFAAMAAVKPDSSAPPIRKPGNQLWFCTHPNQKLWRSFLTIKDESDKDTFYVLERSLAEDLQGEYNTTLFVPCITTQGEIFFWPIKLPDSEGRIDRWNTSKLEHAVGSAGKWIRLRSNQFTEGYDKVTPSRPLPPPTWPEDLLDLLKKAVSKVYIGNLDHPLVKRLLG